MSAYYIGVDVGTASVRAALVKSGGECVAISTELVKIWEPQTNHYEQSSDNIWNACKKTVQTVLKKVEDLTLIRGIGFDATCSLVVLDEDFQPLTVSCTGNNEQNIMMWLDHRASEEAAFINNTNHNVLKYVGGKVSLEMQTPKLMWLKKHIPLTWQKAAHFLDLSDFLTFKATGNLTRSLCSLVCKWTYQPPCEVNNGWSDSYFTMIGLEDLVAEGYSRVGIHVVAPGTPIGSGLSSTASLELGLKSGTPVGSALIDAHAGGIGVMGCTEGNVPVHERLALILGTSSCFMAVSQNPLFVEGVWGPYFSAMIPNFWLNEGGQSATGKLIDHIVQGHSAYPLLNEKANASNTHPYEYLSQLLEKKAKAKSIAACELTCDIHMWPDFHGNRSPLADDTLTGMYGTKMTVDKMVGAGHRFSILHACGGISKNHHFMQTMADVTGLPVVLPHQEESVLLGAAMLGACASGDFPDIQSAMSSMGGNGKVIQPDSNTRRFHSKKFAVFLKMVEDQISYKSIMQS